MAGRMVEAVMVREGDHEPNLPQLSGKSQYLIEETPSLLQDEPHR